MPVLGEKLQHEEGLRLQDSSNEVIRVKRGHCSSDVQDASRKLHHSLAQKVTTYLFWVFTLQHMLEDCLRHSHVN